MRGGREREKRTDCSFLRGKRKKEKRGSMGSFLPGKRGKRYCSTLESREKEKGRERGNSLSLARLKVR